MKTIIILLIIYLILDLYRCWLMFKGNRAVKANNDTLTRNQTLIIQHQELWKEEIAANKAEIEALVKAVQELSIMNGELADYNKSE